MIKMLRTASVCAIAAVAVYGCSAAGTTQSPVPTIAPTPSLAPAPIVTPTALASPGLRTIQMTVAGTEGTSAPIGLTVDLPALWAPHNGPFAANRGTAHPPSGVSFFVSLVDNTFEDPCTHVERSPKIGQAVRDIAEALGDIPHTTAIAPRALTIAGQQATYLEVSVPEPLPCEATSFYLWQDSPGGDWFALGGNETIRIWITEVQGRSVAIAARSYPATSAQAVDELNAILGSMVFDTAT